MLELDSQHRRLQRVESAVDALLEVDILLRRAVIAQRGDALGQCGVMGGDGTGIAECAEVFAGVKAPGHDVAAVADAPRAPGRAVGLCGIFHQAQTVSVADRAQRVEVGRAAVQVHRHHRPSARRDGRLHKPSVDAMGRRIGLHRHRRGADLADRQPTGDVGVGRHDHLVARTDVQRAQRQHQRIQPVAQADAVRGTDRGGEIVLESLDLRPQDVPA